MIRRTIISLMAALLCTVCMQAQVSPGGNLRVRQENGHLVCSQRIGKVWIPIMTIKFEGYAWREYGVMKASADPTFSTDLHRARRFSMTDYKNTKYTESHLIVRVADDGIDWVDSHGGCMVIEGSTPYFSVYSVEFPAVERAWMPRYDDGRYILTSYFENVDSCRHPILVENAYATYMLLTAAPVRQNRTASIAVPTDDLKLSIRPHDYKGYHQGDWQTMLVGRMEDIPQSQSIVSNATYDDYYFDDDYEMRASEHTKGLDIVLDDINYRLFDESMTAVVSSELHASGFYSGHVVIPPTVTYNNKVYTVTELGEDCFNSCPDLLSVKIPETVLRIGRSFSNDERLERVYIPRSVRRIAGANFFMCPNLHTIEVDRRNPYYDSRDHCNAIIETRTATLRCACNASTIPTGVKRLGNNCFNGTNIEELIVPEGIEELGQYCFSGCGKLRHISLPSTLRHIEMGCFSGCYQLDSIYIPDGVTSLGRDCFEACRGLRTVRLPDAITTLDGTFYDCASLTTVNMPKQLKTLSGTFGRCASLTYFIIPESVTTISSWCFGDCKNLQSIHIPSTLSRIDGPVFRGCTALKSITVAADNPVYDSRMGCNAIIETATNSMIQACQTTFIPDGVEHLAKQCFADCTELTTLRLPASVVSIGNLCFEGCKKLGSIEVDASNSVYDSREHCNAIITTETDTLIVGTASTVIPQSVRHIAPYAFNSDDITTAEVGENIESFDYDAFVGCGNIESFICRHANPPAMPGNVGVIYQYTSTLCVPEQSVDAYRRAPFWRNWKKIERFR
ncbi:MAG: leucine-rich repeat protein [Bacteroidaceae bacterium]|nr:leucine-rich repeat protein [Bacteroidaceae bacterium]